MAGLTGGGTRAAWAHSGKELFYAAPDGAMMVVPVRTGSTFSAGNPMKLFDWKTIGQPGPARTYDVAADGQKFLMIKEGGGDQASAPSSIVAVINWIEELRQRVPIK